MILVLLAISLMALALSVLIAFTEIVKERDWPRDTGWYPVAFMFSSLFLFAAI